MKIVLCDDKPSQAKRWERRIRKAFLETRLEAPSIRIISTDTDAFPTIVNTLNARRLIARGESDPISPSNDFPFDDADVLVLDFDLLFFGEHGDTTGARLAYLARCYSSPALIILLNEFGSNRFDLKLSGHLDSFADLDIGGDQIGNVGLWSHDFGSYRPWAWPVVPSAVRTRKRLIRKIAGRLDEAVLPFLGFEEATLAAFSDQVVGPFGDRKQVASATFRDIVQGSPVGLVASDAAPDDFAVAQIAAARIAKWLSDVVLHRQDVIIDAPHLVSRFPRLLAGDPGSHASWAKTVTLSGKIRQVGVRFGLVADHHFPGWEWLGRHCWLWPTLARDERLGEVRSPWLREDPEWVFAEDSSRFLPTAETRRFVSRTDSPFRLRHVERPTRAVEYRPASSFEYVQ